MLGTSRKLMESGGSLNHSVCHSSSDSGDVIDESFTYEHFPVVCPTCKGHGRVADDEANVAIIPVEDKRLRPSRLKLKMLTLLAVTLVSGGLALIFLFPRSVTLTVLHTVPTNYSFPKQGNPFITHQTAVEIKNLNFFTVSVSNFHAKFLYQQQVVGNFFQNASKGVAIKGSEVYTTRVHAIYTQANERDIRKKCYKLQFQFTEELRISAKVSYWYHSERISQNKYVIIDCKHMAFPMEVPLDEKETNDVFHQGETEYRNSSDNRKNIAYHRSTYLRHLNRRYKTLW